MHKIILSALLSLLPFVGLHSQVTGLITVRVVDAEGVPVVGAAAINKASKTGVVADFDGYFSINAASSDQIVVSMLGFDDFSSAASELDGKTITLVETSLRLTESIAVGYGVKKRENLTGAVSAIAGDAQLKTATNSSLAQDLAGKVAGLQIRQENGEPGDFATSINVRGFGSPLYVIDGIPQESGSNLFQRLDPSDIESISVIKDALGAVYGRRGANGVVIVTTKKGNSERPTLNFEAVFGGQTPTAMPEMCNRGQWATLYNESQIFKGQAAYTAEQLAAEWQLPSTDWYSEIMKDFSFQQQYHLSLEGKTKTNNYYVGVGYVDDKGLLKTENLNYKKVDFRSNVGIDATKNLHIDFNVSGSSDRKQAPSSGFYSIFFSSRTALPASPVYANGNKDYLSNQSYTHPLALSLSDISGETNTQDMVFNGGASIRYTVPFIEGLSAQLNYNYAYRGISTKGISKEYNLYTYDAGADPQYAPIAVGSPSSIYNSYTTNQLHTLQAMINYSHTFADIHNLSAMAVYEQTSYNTRYSYLRREYDFYTGDQIDLAGENNQRTSGMEDDKTNQSYIGRISYGLKDRYLFDVSFRVDGSCLYSPEKRWGFFPVASAAWRISEEPWMKNIDLISNLKIRASYGLVGEDNGKPFQYVEGFSIGGGGGYEFQDGTWTTGAAAPTIVNRNLTWFTSNLADVGIDIGLFRGKLSFSFDFYNRDRSGLLSTRLTSLPNTFGASLPQENLNSDRTMGFDFSGEYHARFGEFNLGVAANLNFARTRNLYVEQGEFTSSMSYWRNSTSNRFNDVYWGYVCIGQFQSEEEILNSPIQSSLEGNRKVLPGDYKYQDINEDGVIDGNDTVPLFYSGYPKLFYGFTINGNWKGFDLSLVFQGSGFNTIRFTEMYAEVLAYNRNTPEYFYDRWHRVDMYDPSSEWVAGRWPSTRLMADSGSNYYESSVWRKDVSYLRLKNLTFGYSIPKKIISKAKISALRVYFNANNLLTICDKFVKPYDPEKTVGTSSMGCNYPLVKSYNFGINISF